MAAIVVSLVGISPVIAAPAAKTKQESGDPSMAGMWRRVKGDANTYDPKTTNETQIQSAPYNAEYMKKYKAILDNTANGGRNFDPTARCIPPGMPRTMNAVFGFEILLQPGQVTLIAEYFGEVRRIYTDQRPHPDDLEPSFVGDSIGHWEGKTLVVETVGIKAGTALDVTLAPRSEDPDQRVLERWTMAGPSELKVEMTLIDKGALTGPWTVTKRYTRAPAGDYMREYVCAENDRDSWNPNPSPQSAVSPDPSPVRTQ